MPPPLLNEDSLSEIPAVEQLKRMGYEYVHGDRFDPQINDDCERSSRREVVLVGRLRSKLKELNAEATDETIEKAIRAVTNIQGTGLIDENRKFHHDLVSNISIEQDGAGGRRGQTVKFVDFEDAERNEFLAVNQFWVKGPKPPDRRPDIVIFVNGIPVALIECKSPVAKEKGVKDALHDLLFYQENIPSLFRTNQILIGTSLFKARYGVVGAGGNDFHEWKAKPNEKLPAILDHPTVREMIDLHLMEEEDLPKESHTAQDVVIASLLNKKNLLDIIRNFTVFEVESGKIEKKVCRYQQFTSVQKIVARVLHEPEKKGIIWHWQGSGKSLTMLFAALKLKREEEKLKNPSIVIVTDRKDLDGQIEKTFLNCGFPNPIRVDSSRELYERLSGQTGQTIMTTVQKFRAEPEAALTTSSNIIVLTDEAHRTQYGNLAYNLRKALPNAAFLAFTGTPLNKNDRNTYRLYSPPGENYLDRYSTLQAEQDGATVPIKYVSRLPDLQIVGSSLDAMLRHLFPDKSDEELKGLKKQYGTMEIIQSAPKRIERIALDILEHYSQFIRPNGFKAMIVTESKEMADAYKQALDRFFNPELSKVVMTIDDSKGSKDNPEWKEKYRLTEEQERAIKERFIKPDDPLCFLIVCDKLLTGFDAKVLQAMYLDKRLKEHTLLQAVARTNRTFPGKYYGLIVDYVGLGRELAQAVEMFSAEDLQGIFHVDDLERELEALKENHKTAMSIFQGVVNDHQPPKVLLQKCLEILQDAKVRAAFDMAYLAMAKNLDFLLPDLRVGPYLKDFKFLGALREGAKNLFRDERMKTENVSQKVIALIHAHIAAEGMEQLLEPLTISAPNFSEQMNEKGSDKSKAAHVEYALKDLITAKAAENPAFYASLQRQLEELIEAQKKERWDDAKALQERMRLAKAAVLVEEQAKSIGLKDQKEFSFYGTVEKFKSDLSVKDQPDQVDLTKEIIRIIEDRAVAEWEEREDVQKEMRREMKRLFRKRGCADDKLDPLALEFIQIAQRWVKA